MDYEKWALDYVLDDENSNTEIVPEINIEYISYDDMKNGTGLRTVMWVTGCSHRCKGCHNPQTWDCNHGVPFTPDYRADILDSLKPEWIEGITFSGGDPLFQRNRKTIGELIRDIKKLYPEKNIWLYTGYTLTSPSECLLTDKKGDIIQVPFLRDVDVLVDGPFIQEIRDADLKLGMDPLYRGSSNQRIVDMKTSIKTGKIVLKEV